MDYDDAVHGVYRNRNDYSNYDHDVRVEVGLGQSPLDTPFTITIFPDQYAKSKKQCEVTLRRFAKLIKKKWAPAKENLPWLKAAEFGDKRTDKHCLRNNANVICVNGVEADYDGEKISADRARLLLFNAGITAIVYETPSSTPDKPRWRILSLFRRSRPAIERARFIARLNGIFGGTLDGSCFTISQAFYYGNVVGKEPVNVHLVEGTRFIDEADDLDLTAKWKLGSSSEAGEKPDEPFNESEMLRRIWTGENYHGAAIALAGHWAKTDVAPILAMKKLREAFLTVTESERDKRWLERFASLDEILLYVYQAQAAEYIADRDYWVNQLDDEDVLQAKVEVLSTSEYSNSPQREYVIKGFLAKGDLGCIVGAPGVGKSLITPLIAHAVAQGETVFKMRTKPGPTFYVAAEDETGMTSRFLALGRVRGEAKALFLVTGVSDLLARDSDDLTALADEVQRRRPVLIVIDTLAMAFPGLEENSAEGMGRVVAAARSLTKWGAAVLLVHHDTKDGANGLPRGHSLLNGALDVSLHLKKQAHGVRGELTKNRNGTVDKKIFFDIAVLSMGMDDDGDEITAAYCRELDDGPDEKRLPASAQAAYKVLHKLLETNAVVQKGRRGVREEIWKAACINGRDVSTSNKEDSRRTATDRAIRELMARNKVEFWEDTYWVVVTARGASEAFNEESEEELV